MGMTEMYIEWVIWLKGRNIHDKGETQGEIRVGTKNI